MTLEIAVVALVLVAALGLLVTERLRGDVVGLLVLVTLAVTGIVTPEAALAGFSNPAVVTVLAMYILSEGLTRTGIAGLLGGQLVAIAGSGEARLTVAIMVTAGTLSAFMNNIGVAALLLPVVVEIARRTEVPASRLLLPMLHATLLGGLTTLFSTPPNLIASAALADAGATPFRLLDFLPSGLAAFVVGATFMVLVGRRLLPRTDPGAESAQRSQRNLRAQYGLQESTYVMRVPAGSLLVGRTLAQTRLGTAAGLIVIAREHAGRVEALPSRNAVLAAGDRLVVQGRLDRFAELRRWSGLVIEPEAPGCADLVSGLVGDPDGGAISPPVQLAEATVGENSGLAQELLHHAEFRRRFGANVLAIKRGDLVRRVNLNYVPLRPGDQLLLQGSAEALAAVDRSREFDRLRPLTDAEVRDDYRLQERTFVVRVPAGSPLSGATLAASRVGDAFDFRLLALWREGALTVMPEPDAAIAAGDLLLIQGRPEDLDVLRGLQQLELEERVAPNLNIFDSDRLATAEVTLAPNTPLAGKRVADVNLREKYGLELVALWRAGGALRTDLGQQQLRFGDALLLLGPRTRLALLKDDPDLLLLTPVGPAGGEPARAPLAAVIMAAVVMASFSGQLPIAIAALTGALLMVVGGCLSMEQAYRAVEWRAIFTIAGMLPLGAALADSGAAHLAADALVGTLGGLGAWPVVGGFYLVTAALALFVPPAVLAVVMAPLLLSASTALGIAPQAPMMALAMACTSFASPWAHPANLLIMGPGGYRFRDYLRVGIPLTLLVFLTAMVVLPRLWPLLPAGAGT